MVQQKTLDPAINPPPTEIKPLLRGWFHAVTAALAVILTLILCWRTRSDGPRLLSMLIFGLSMIELYTLSAIYHIGHWRPTTKRVLRSVDHANIFVLIAGTYTPICYNVLSGNLRIGILSAIWLLALLGIGIAIFFLKLPRFVTAGLYVAMGWVVVLALPVLLTVLPWQMVGTLLLGGLLYTVGAVVYGLRWPDPFPRVFGFHEIFHLFVIAGSFAFAAAIWIWVVPFPRI